MSLITQYKSMTEEVTAKLLAHHTFRDWNERNPYLAVLAMRAMNRDDLPKDSKGNPIYPDNYESFKLFEGETKIPLTMAKLIQFAIKYDSYRNTWDVVMKDHKEWQSESYDKGKIMEQQVVLAKGYTPGKNQIEKEMEEALKNW